jgi:hypothetical protein
MATVICVGCASGVALLLAEVCACAATPATAAAMTTAQTQRRPAATHFLPVMAQL